MGQLWLITPQDLVPLNARRTINMARTMKVPVLGIIENMSGFNCPKCGKAVDLFKIGGDKRVAEEMGVPFLGRIEIDPKICETGDSGKPFILNAQSSTADAFDQIVQNIIKHYER